MLKGVRGLLAVLSFAAMASSAISAEYEVITEVVPRLSKAEIEHIAEHTQDPEFQPKLIVADFVGQCERSANGLGIGKCTHGIRLDVRYAPLKLTEGKYTCLVSWMLERPGYQSEILEFPVKVTVPLKDGFGTHRYEVTRDMEEAEDFDEDPLGLMRTDTSCIPLNY